MGHFEILAVAVALALDATAVAIGVSAVACGPGGPGCVSPRQAFRLSFHFGLFQALMPVAGFWAGRSVAQLISAWDHWVAFGLLALVGGRALWGAFAGGEHGPDCRTDGPIADPTRGLSLVLLSVATSIDALAVGISLALVQDQILYPAAVIGIVAAAFTLAGLWLGSRVGRLLGRYAEVVGGLVLIAIGVRILVDHLTTQPGV